MATVTIVTQTPTSGAISFNDLNLAVSRASGALNTNYAAGQIENLFGELNNKVWAAGDNPDINGAHGLPQDQFEVTTVALVTGTVYGDMYGYDNDFVDAGVDGAVADATVLYNTGTLINITWTADGLGAGNESINLAIQDTSSPPNSGWEILGIEVIGPSAATLNYKRSDATFTPNQGGGNVSVWQWAGPATTPWGTSDTLDAFLF